MKTLLRAFALFALVATFLAPSVSYGQSDPHIKFLLHGSSPSGDVPAGAKNVALLRFRAVTGGDEVFVTGVVVDLTSGAQHVSNLKLFKGSERFGGVPKVSSPSQIGEEFLSFFDQGDGKQISGNSDNIFTLVGDLASGAVGRNITAELIRVDVNRREREEGKDAFTNKKASQSGVPVAGNVIAIVAPPSVPQNFCTNIPANLGQGDEGEKVQALHFALMKEGVMTAPEFRGGLSIAVRPFFGEETKAAVIKFQENHAEDILAPNDLQKGNGVVGRLTRAKLNALYRCDAVSASEAKSSLAENPSQIEGAQIEGGNVQQSIAQHTLVASIPKIQQSNRPIVANSQRVPIFQFDLYNKSDEEANIETVSFNIESGAGALSNLKLYKGSGVFDTKNELDSVGINGQGSITFYADEDSKKYDVVSFKRTKSSKVVGDTIYHDIILENQNIRETFGKQMNNGATTRFILVADVSPTAPGTLQVRLNYVNANRPKLYDVSTTGLTVRANDTRKMFLNQRVVDKQNRTMWSKDFRNGNEERVGLMGTQFAIAATPQGVPISFCYDFSTNLQRGDTGDGVSALQDALYKEGVLSVVERRGNFEGEIHSVFGDDTKAAVIAFQERYAADILVPNDLQKGNGVVGRLTRITLNERYGCAGRTTETPIPNSITVLSPNGGNVLLVGQSHQIRWRSSDIAPQQKIDITLLDEASRLGKVIFSGVPNDGTENWIIAPLTAADLFNSKTGQQEISSGRYAIHVQCADDSSVNCIVDTSDSSFSIVGGTGTPAPIPASSITVLSPNGGESLQAGTTYQIRWNGSRYPSGAGTILELESGAFFKTMIARTQNTGSYNFIFPATLFGTDLTRLGATNKIVVSVFDGFQYDIDRSDAPFSIVAATAPTITSALRTPIVTLSTSTTSSSASITVLSPNGPAALTAGLAYPITWRAVNVSNVTVKICHVDTSSCIEIGRASASAGSYVWLIPTNFQWIQSISDLKIRVEDSSNAATYDESDGAFSVQPLRTPILSSLSVSSGPPGTTVTISGNNLANINTVKMGSVTITSSASSGSGSTVAFVVPSTMSAGTYPVTVMTSAGISNSLNFTVVASSGSTNLPPRLIGVTGFPSLSLGTNAVWNVNASDPEGGVLTYRVNWGDGSAIQTNQTGSFTHAYTAAGSYTPNFTVTDNAGLSASINAMTTTIAAPTVANLPPTISGITSISSLNLGTTGTWTIGASDPEGRALTYYVSWGDGVTNNAGIATLSHTYAAAGTYPITYWVTDSAGLLSNTQTTRVVVSAPVSPPPPTTSTNLRPVISDVAGPSFILTKGTFNTWEIQATDPEGGPLTYNVAWGDGSPASQIPTTTEPAFNVVTFTHQYTVAGTYTIVVTVTDNGGLSTQYTLSNGVRVSLGDTPELASLEDAQSLSQLASMLQALQVLLQSMSQSLGQR